MVQQTDASRIKVWAKAILILAVVSVWLSLITSGIMAQACRKDRYEGAKKLRFCDISIIAGSWLEVRPKQKAKGARVHLERGIALSQLGREDEAIEAFHTALSQARATRGNGEWFVRLHSRMEELSESNVFSVWTTALKTYKYF